MVMYCKVIDSVDHSKPAEKARIPLVRSSRLFASNCVLMCLSNISNYVSQTPILAQSTAARRNCEVISRRSIRRRLVRALKLLCYIICSTPISMTVLHIPPAPARRRTIKENFSHDNHKFEPQLATLHPASQVEDAPYSIVRLRLWLP